MNKVFLSGVILDTPSANTHENIPKRTSFLLYVRHRTRQGLVKYEKYPIRAWNGVAEWACANLRQGQQVMVQGYLTQRYITPAEGRGYVGVEVTADEFFTTADAPRASHVVEKTKSAAIVRCAGNNEDQQSLQERAGTREPS